MSVAIKNSKFSSLSFIQDWRNYFETKKCYIQKFSVLDEIRVQFKSNTLGFSAKYINNIGNCTNIPIELIYKSGTTRIYESVFTISDPGTYEFIITNGTAEIGTYFCILPLDQLEDTILLSYTHRKDDFETIFTDRIFNFRVEGGFLYRDISQAVNNSTFRDQRYTIYQLSSIAHQVKVLTIGSTTGVPQWIGNKVNHIFDLFYVYVDGVRTTRSESSVPELVSLADYYPFYVHKISVEQSDDEDILIPDNYAYLIDNQGRYILTSESKKIKVKVR